MWTVRSAGVAAAAAMMASLGQGWNQELVAQDHQAEMVESVPPRGAGAFGLAQLPQLPSPGVLE